MAEFDFTATDSDEMSFKTGDVMLVSRAVAEGANGWWMVRHETTGGSGNVPGNYLKLL